MKKSIIASAAIALSITLSAGTVHASNPLHTVTSKDTFWKLSQQYQVSLKSILNANPSVDPLNLQAGMKVKIPTADPKAATVEVKQTEPAKVLASANETVFRNVQGPGGYDYLYTKQLTLKATAYSSDPKENGGWGAVDYFGNKLRIGTVAVDPAQIPLGTKLFITGYDYFGLPKIGIIATASDVGGAIKGDRIDIFVPGSKQKVLDFGIQTVTAYVLK